MLTRTSLILCAALAAACGNDVSASLITAEAGGTVTSSTADIVIPAASLTADTEVMIGTAQPDELPALENVRVIVDLTPRGTVLETAASVTISGSEIGASDGQRVAVYQLLDGWLPAEFTTGEGGDITVSVTRFEPIGVTVTDAPSAGTIEGTITWGGSGDPAAQAPVELHQGVDMPALATSVADENGRFVFTDLEPGTYSLIVNYECMINMSVGLEAGATESVDLVLCGS